MSKQNKKDKIRKDESGILTLDFIFSIMAVYAISMVFALLAMTLVFSSISQYVAFSVSRAHISGQITVDDQQVAMQEQFQKIMDLPFIEKFLKTSKGKWFQLEMQGPAGEHFDLSSTDEGGKRQMAYGVKLKYTSHILKNFKLPLLGNPSDGATGDFGTANVYSFLYREPTTTECLEFNNARWSALKDRFPQITTMPGFSDSKNYGSEADNGC